jgi:transcriptional regulator with XRE-family HTH domain/tetratricopeptide (TPR) repeat protein
MKREKLIRARLKKGLSQEAAAELIGVSRNAWSLWELGKEDPYPLNVGELCKFFGVKEPGELDLEPTSLRTEKVWKGSTTSHTLAILTPHSPNASAETPLTEQRNLTADSSHSIAQETPGEADLFTIGIMALTLHQQQQQWSINELEQRVTQALDEMVPGMQNFQRTSRRSFFHFMASLPFALQHFANVASRTSFSFVLEEVLPFYVAGIPACWRLYYEVGQTELERVLPGYLSHLTKLAQEPSTLQKNIAGLLSQTHQLMALLEQRRENFGRAIQHCQQAAFYGQLAEDSNLHAMALIRQFDTCKENKRIGQSIHLLKEVESFSGQITPLLRGRMFARLSYAYAYQSYTKEAYHYLDLAQQTFPSHPENDASFLYNHTTHFVLYANQALTYVQLGHPHKAWEAITQAGQFVDPTNPRNIDLTHHQIQIAVALDNLEQSCCLFETLIGFVKQYGHTLDMDNAYDAYQQIVMHWPREQQVRQLEAALHT